MRKLILGFLMRSVLGSEDRKIKSYPGYKG